MSRYPSVDRSRRRCARVRDRDTERWRLCCFAIRGGRESMVKLAMTALLGLLAVPAYAQAPANSTPQRVTADQPPLFRVTVVGRTTAAINYRPRSGDTKVDFAGTALLP